MAQKPAIRLDRFFFRMVRQSPHHSPLRRRPQNAVVGKMHPAEEILARGNGSD